MTNDPIPSEEKKLPRRGIHLLPSILTTCNIFCGFFAITSALAGDLDMAAKAIGVAIVLDGFDGRIARMVGATSQFGLQLDSLADTVSFGVAPAFLLWTWHLRDHPYIGWIACFLFLVCGVMRLARFNVQTGDLKCFIGLPIPAAAGLVAALAHFAAKYQHWPFFQSVQLTYVLIGMAFLLSVLMISTIRYTSFKSLDLRRGRSQVNILVIAVLVAGVWFFSQEVLLFGATFYFLSGLAGVLRRKFFTRAAVSGTPAAEK